MKNRYTVKLFCLLFLALWTTQELKAQDPHFAQVNAAPSQLNPAMIGVYEGQFRVVMNYRDQWRSLLQDVPFRTFSASFDAKFYAMKNDFFSVGMSVMSDRAGTSNFTQTQTHLGFSYMKQLVGGRGHRDVQYLIAGAQAGFGQNGINWNTFRWSTQFDGQGYDGSLPTGEDVGAQSNLYTDFNAGLMWYGLFGNNRSAYLGGAMHHINTPNVSLYANEIDPLYRRFTVHGGGEIPLTRDATLLPGARFLRQGPSYEASFGSSIRFSTRDFRDVALRTGVWGRIVNDNVSVSSDAVSVIAALEWERWILGLSYDVTVSDLKNLNDKRGAFEMSLIYTNPAPRRVGMYCPTF